MHKNKVEDDFVRRDCNLKKMAYFLKFLCILEKFLGTVYSYFMLGHRYFVKCLSSLDRERKRSFTMHLKLKT